MTELYTLLPPEWYCCACGNTDDREPMKIEERDKGKPYYFGYLCRWCETPDSSQRITVEAIQEAVKGNVIAEIALERLIDMCLELKEKS